MIDKEKRAKTNITVTIINGKAIGDIAVKELGDKLPIGATLSTLGEYGYVKTKKGTYLLHSEGVGNIEPLERESDDIELYRTDIMTCMPTCTVKVDSSNLHEFAVFSEKIKLSDFIRSFGSRLESNYEKWNQFLTEAKQIRD